MAEKMKFSLTKLWWCLLFLKIDSWYFQSRSKKNIYIPMFFFFVEAVRPSQQFSVMSGRSHLSLDITSTFGE